MLSASTPEFLLIEPSRKLPSTYRRTIISHTIINGHFISTSRSAGLCGVSCCHYSTVLIACLASVRIESAVILVTSVTPDHPGRAILGLS